MYLLRCIFLASIINYTFARYDSFFTQVDSNCNSTSNFMCRNNQCVSSNKRCDGHVDCSDGTDEEDCDLFFCKEPNYFKCKNSKCIFHSFACDGDDDCGDYSDEENCNEFKLMINHASNCSKDDWQCVDKLCIPKDFVCNGEKDCLDGTDETLGCTQNLPCDSFKCKNGHCIPHEWVCDGKDDCHDNTDELDCQSHISPKDCTLDRNRFLCANKINCINLTNVCDKISHCPDKSDEGGLCQSPNNCQSQHYCSHECKQLPTGPKCLCPEGYEIIDNNTCKDINECEIYGICDQKCKNTPGSYKCYCDDRYVLQNDSKTCKVIGGEALMVFSANTEIRGYFLQSNVLFPIAKDLKQVVGVAYEGHHVYWTDISSEHESLVRSLEDGSQKELLVTSGLGIPEDLAIDWITGNIYFTDSEMQHIGVCNNNGMKCTVLINQDIQKPRGIVLHPVQGEMYWSDWGKKPEIAKSKMDGTQDIGFVTANIHWPNGLAIDYPNERLYWTDAKLLTLESIRLDGTDRRVVLEGIVKHPYAVAVFENRLYWSDITTHSIQSCDKFTGKDHHTLVKEKRKLIYGLHIFHSALKPRTVNPCALAFCTDICLISGPKSYTCACPQNKILATDKQSCIEQQKRQALIVGTNNILIKVEHQILGKHDIEALPTAAKKIGPLAYSPVNNSMFIADIDSKSIMSVAFENGISTTILSDNIEKINSMSYDYLGNNLYWTDSEKKTVEMLSLKTMARKIVLHDMGGEIPSSIALVPEEGIMFISMKSASGHGVHIDRIQMDGTSRSHIVESGLLGPVTLHYDHGLHRIFWVDSGTGNIESTSADGDDRHGFRALRTTPISLTTLAKDLFWTNKNSRRLYWASKDNTNDYNKKITLNLPESIDDMHLVSITQFPIAKHPCQTENGYCSHLCIPLDKNAHCACPLGMGLKSDNRTCIKRLQCNSDEFYCHTSNICIPKVMRCNSRKDCFHGEDEDDCVNERHCPTTYFQCKNGECIKSDKVCDLHFDCSDKSDETDCLEKSKNTCPKKQYKCSSGFCISERFLCDGVRDCADGDDEENCLTTTCAANQFRCLSGMCIPKNWECDHDYDCPDLSDEHPQCAQRSCKENQFKCTNGLCIDNKLKCNNIDDCGDSSDESLCERVNGSSACGPNEFQCISDPKICIPVDARCNGSSECPHHEDEQGCSDCHIDEYECGNKKCIPTYWICDKSDDCGDGTDENICSSGFELIMSNTSPCENGFRCKSGACIDFNLVCNGIENCYDGSDEDGACNSSCKAINNPCQHKCQPTPTGAICRCNEGYEIAGDQFSCRDIAECSMDPPICSQLCTERIGGYSCDCFDGFAIRSDKVSCKSEGESMMMLFSINNEIRMLSQSNNSLTIIHSEDNPRITGLDISTKEQYVYFSIEDAGSIHKINLVNGKREYIKEIGKPQQLAVDWHTQNIYFVDSDTAGKSIQVCNFNEKLCVKVINVDIHSQVSSLVVDSVNKYIFYTLTSWWIFNTPSSVIYKANLDGTKVQELVKSTSGSVTGITYDFNKKILYYLDQHNGAIYKLNYDGTDKAMIISDLTKPNGLSFFEDHLYYLTHSGYMGKCKLYGKERTCDKFRLSAYNADLFVISQNSKQPIGSNMCESHSCKHMCIPSDVGVRCLCESGKVIQENTNCEYNEISKIKERKNPKFGEHVQDEEGSSIFVPFFLVLFFGAIGGVLYYIFKKRNSGKFNISMRFHNPIYGITSRNSDSARVMLQPGEHEYCNPVINSQNALLEKVTPLIKIDD